MQGRTRPVTRLAAALALPCVLAAAMYSILLLPPDTVARLTAEDGPVESAGAVALVACAALSLLAWRRRRDLPPVARYALLALTAVYVFGAGEEISWGQRIFGIETPEAVRRVNEQGELNVHNWVELTGVFDLDYAFRDFWILFGVVVPVVALWPRARERLTRVVPLIPIWIASGLVANQLLAAAAEHALRRLGSGPAWFDLVKDATVETKESIACLLLAVGMYAVYRSFPLVPTDSPAPSEARSGQA